MYQKPQMERFGTFRELTQIGFNGSTDGFTICGIGTGNELCGGPEGPAIAAAVYAADPVDSSVGQPTRPLRSSSS